MNYNASDYVFKAPPVISRARRVLIKPAVSYPAPYPVTTNPEMITQIIQGIRQVSDADILILGGTPTGAMTTGKPCRNRSVSRACVEKSTCGNFLTRSRLPSIVIVRFK